jgi:hypothetical protein
MFGHWRITKLLTVRGAFAALSLITLVAGCSVYTEGLLLAGNAGTRGEGAASGAGQMQVYGGAPANNAGAEGGGTSGAATAGGSAGARASGGAAGLPGHVSAGEGGEGAEGGQGEAQDECPEDEEKVEPGACGCGVPESCADLKAALVHRYDFGQAGTIASDSIGDADGVIVGAAAADGELAFDGTTVAYVDLPNGMISALTNASFEIWLEWHGGVVWQRIFDFGTSDNGEDEQGRYAPTYLNLIPSDGRPGNALCASFSNDGLGAETRARAAAALPTGSRQHLVVVVDDTNNELRLYSNGTLSASTSFNESLSSLNDVNNWLGRSNYVDGPLNATIEEFRIYEVALDAAQVAASSDFGPNPSFL